MDAREYLITAEELKRERSEKSDALVLVDVREPEEWAESRIEGATLIPLGELLNRAPSELRDPDADIVLYCAHGVRSLHALVALQRLGYQKLRSLRGGICEWETSAPT